MEVFLITVKGIVSKVFFLGALRDGRGEQRAKRTCIFKKFAVNDRCNYVEKITAGRLLGRDCNIDSRPWKEEKLMIT